MKNFLKKQKEYIALALFLIMIFGLLHFVVIPLLGKIDGIKNVMEEATLKQEIKKQRLEELPKIREQYSEIENQQEKIEVLLSKKQAVALIERLEKLAQDTGNKISISIQEDAPKKSAPIGSLKKDSPETTLVDSLPSKNYLRLKIILLGDYSGIFRFISSLETLEYYSDIVSINIGQVTDEQTVFGQSTSNGFDVASPFNAQNSDSAIVSKKSAGKLSASLETVFYSKD